MSDISVSSVTNLVDPKLKAIAERVLNIFQLAAQKAAAHQAELTNFPLSDNANSAERLFLSRLSGLPAAKQQAAAAKALTAIKAPDSERASIYGDLARIDLHAATAVEEQARNLVLPAALQFPISYLNNLTQLHSQILVPEPIAIHPERIGLRPQQTLNKLMLRIQKVKCTDETDPEWPGNDTISLGGVTIDALGDTVKIDEFQVRDDFSDGVEQVYSPPKPFAIFDLTKGGAGQDLYAAIWEHNAGPAQQARHGMTRAQYQQAFDELGRQGYRLVSVNGYSLDNQDLYAAIWEKSAGPAWQAKHAMTRAQYQQAFNDFAAQGYRLNHISGYGVNGQDLYAAIWEKSAGPAWQAKHAMTRAQYQKAFDDYASQGYRLVHVCGYSLDTIGGQSQDLYAAIWKKSAGPAWQAKHAMTPEQFQIAFNDLGNKGYRLTRVSGYNLGQQILYAAIWEQRSGSAWVERSGMTAIGYQQAYNDLSAQGYRLLDVSGYAIWPTFPKSYFATFVLAEKDWGGFADFLSKLWEQVKGKVLEIITAALGAAIGALIGTDVIPGLGTILGAVVGWVIGNIVQFLIDLFGDDVFEPFSVSINVPSLNARFSGDTTNSAVKTITYYGYGGEYELDFDWQLSS